MNRICSITKRVITDRGLCYCPVGEGANGRIRPDVVKSKTGRKGIQREATI